MNGNVYYSVFRDKPCFNGKLNGHTETRRVKPANVSPPMEEMDMEMMVAEHLCYQTLCPAWREQDTIPLPKDDWDNVDFVCDGNLGGFKNPNTAYFD